MFDWIETDPGTGLLAVSAVALLVIGVMTLTGTWALLIWVAFIGIAVLVTYGLGVRVARRLRGESSNTTGSSGGQWGGGDG